MTFSAFLFQALNGLSTASGLFFVAVRSNWNLRWAGLYWTFARGFITWRSAFTNGAFTFRRLG